jgi:hypothetical protein
VRAHRVYGYSPVQQVLITVNIALRRQLWQLDYYSEGSIPDALIGVPNSWTPDQIKQFQDYWDTDRATADNQSAQAEDEGLEPTKEWVKDLVDEIIADEFASPDLELVWLDEDTDAAQAEAQLESRVKLGAVTLNEMRDAHL